MGDQNGRPEWGTRMGDQNGGPEWGTQNGGPEWGTRIGDQNGPLDPQINDTQHNDTRKNVILSAVYAGITVKSIMLC